MKIALSIEEIKALHVYELSDLAGCANPNNATSAGSIFLDSVRTDFVDRVEDETFDEDIIHEIADNAPDIYTYTRWQEFVDLGAWDEDCSDMLSGAEDMTTRAGVALYNIAERLVYALADKAGVEF